MMSRAALVSYALAQSGCFPITVGTTRHEQLENTVVETRVSGQQADIAGSLCYVDNRHQVRMRKHVPMSSRLGAGLELIGGGTISLFGSPAVLYALPFILDGLLTIIYIKGQDEKVFSSRSWEKSNDTAACKR